MGIGGRRMANQFYLDRSELHSPVRPETVAVSVGGLLASRTWPGLCELSCRKGHYTLHSLQCSKVTDCPLAVWDRIGGSNVSLPVPCAAY